MAQAQRQDFGPSAFQTEKAAGQVSLPEDVRALLEAIDQNYPVAGKSSSPEVDLYLVDRVEMNRLDVSDHFGPDPFGIDATIARRLQISFGRPAPVRTHGRKHFRRGPERAKR